MDWHDYEDRHQQAASYDQDVPDTLPPMWDDFSLPMDFPETLPDAQPDSDDDVLMIEDTLPVRDSFPESQPEWDTVCETLPDSQAGVWATGSLGSAGVPARAAGQETAGVLAPAAGHGKAGVPAQDAGEEGAGVLAPATSLGSAGVEVPAAGRESAEVLAPAVSPRVMAQMLPPPLPAAKRAKTMSGHFEFTPEVQCRISMQQKSGLVIELD